MKTRTLTLASVASVMMASLTTACDDSPTPPPPVAPAVVFARGGNGDNNGRILFSSDRELPGSPDVYAMNPDGSGVTRLTSDPSGDGMASWSPDGKQIVFVSDRHDANFEIYVMNADGTGVTRLTNSSGVDAYPSWSKDGKRIVFASNRASGVPDDPDLLHLDIFVMNADGSGVTRITNSSKAELMPSFSPDGKRIAFVREGATPQITEIVTMNADGTGATEITSEGLFSITPAWAPGGKQLAFSNQDGINVINADGSGLTTIVPGPDVYAPSWSDDGKLLVFQGGASPNENVFSVRADGTAMTQLTFSPASDTYPSWRR